MVHIGREHVLAIGALKSFGASLLRALSLPEMVVELLEGSELLARRSREVSPFSSSLLLGKGKSSLLRLESLQQDALRASNLHQTPSMACLAHVRSRESMGHLDLNRCE